jgi:hypothetical protein
MRTVSINATATGRLPSAQDIGWRPNSPRVVIWPRSARGTFRDRTLAANQRTRERLELPLPEALQQLVRDDEAVDLVRALVDLGAFRVAHQAFDAGFPRVAGAAE